MSCQRHDITTSLAAKMLPKVPLSKINEKGPMFRQYCFSFSTAPIYASYFVQAPNLRIILDALLSYIPHLNPQEILVPWNSLPSQ